MREEGKIIKGIAGFYYVDVVGSGVYECRAKGLFRKEGQKPLVGDEVEIEVLSREDMEGNLQTILPRKNELIRPAVANVDQALIVFAVKRPTPHLHLLDRFLIMMETKEIPVILCFNKKDIAEDEEMGSLYRTYEQCGYPVLFSSTVEPRELTEIKRYLRGKTTVIAGPSGVGKSSIINQLQSEIAMETGEISEKIERGRHTTRHSELIPIDRDTYIMDTPGFSSLHTMGVNKEGLKYCIREFAPYEGSCRFQGCDHIHEPDCAVKRAVEEGRISKTRYQNYVSMYEELKEREARRY